MGYIKGKFEVLDEQPEFLTSWQGRNEARDHYGGAIRGRLCDWAVSGFTERVDTSICLALARFVGDISNDDLARIAVLYSADGDLLVDVEKLTLGF